MDKITDAVLYVGVDDPTLDLFESQYVTPEGMCYNSYVILDEKIAILDAVDSRCVSEWLDNVARALDGRQPDYLVLHHMEPDHAGGVQALIERYPNLKLVGNKKTFQFLAQFYSPALADGRTVSVAEGSVLELGAHTLRFFLAPMVHWPEVMVSFEEKEGLLFSADAFGKFGVRDADPDDWACEARRYYVNIVGKYGGPVQALLKKLDSLTVQAICPLHGPVLTENLPYYLGKYNVWSSYQPEDRGVVIACASIHGNTAAAAKRLGAMLEEKGAESVTYFDLSRCDMAEAVEDAFRYDRLVLAASSYDGGVFPPMETFLLHLRDKRSQNRSVAYLQNGSWAPTAAKTMKAIVGGLKNIKELDPPVTIRSALKDEDLPALEALAEAILQA
ncbi:MAG: FprA family A-type flavoprotein [Oscillospiraceae bacterium]|nr:FprA family A-type flavoprotein [Oscillospiraceae bacterium]